MTEYLDVQRNTTLALDTHIVLDTANRGLTQAFVIGSPGSTYDLTGCTLEFRVNTPAGTITGTDTTVTDATGGTFTVTWPQALYDHAFDSYSAVFLIKKGDTVVDSTSNFWMTVQPTAGVVEVVGKSTLDGVAENLATIAQAATEAQKIATDAGNITSGVSAQATAKLADLSKQFDDAKTAINAEIQSVSDESTTKLTAVDKTIADKLSDLNDQITAAQTNIATQIKAISDSSTTKLADVDTALATKLAAIEADGAKAATDASAAVQKQYATDVATIKADAVQQVKDVVAASNSSLDDIESKINAINTTELPAMQTTADDLKKQINDLKANEDLAITGINSHDGTALTAVAGKVNLPDYALNSALSDMETKADASATYQPKGSYLVAADIAGLQSKTDADTAYQPKGSYVAPTDISDMETKTDAKATYQPKGSYQPAGDYATNAAIADMETKTDAGKTYQPKGSYLTPDAIADMETKTDAGKTYATKAELAAGGKVQTATVNGGAVISPDTNGNLPITVAMPNLAPYETTAALNTTLASYAKSSDVDTKIGAIDLTPYATTSAMNAAITAAKPNLTPYATTQAMNTAIGAIPKPDMTQYVKLSDLPAAVASALTAAGAVTAANFDDMAYTWKAKAFLNQTQAVFNALPSVDKRNDYRIIPG